MKSSSIEKIGVITTQDAILESDNLHAWIQDGDKMPSWDGDILYNPNNSDSKEGLLKISIQVKTKTVNNFNLEFLTFLGQIVKRHYSYSVFCIGC